MPTPEEKILNQLQGAPRINPASARLFTDWTLEPGDVVTVRSTEGDSVRNYQLPIYSMDFNWNGSPMMEISSSGNPEREPLPELVRKEYAEATSSRGMGRRIAETEEEIRQYRTWQTKTDKKIGDYAEIMGVTIDPTTGDVVYETDEQGNIRLDDDGNPIPVFDPTSPYSLYAKHEVTAQRIVNYVGLTGIRFDAQGNPIYKQAKDAQGNPIYDSQGNPVYETDSQGNPIPDLDAGDGHSMYSQISQTVGEIGTVVSGHTGSISTLSQTATSLTTRIGTAEGNISTLQQTATNLTSRIETAEGYYSVINQNATSIGMVVAAPATEGGSPTIRAAAIAAAINANGSEAYINADHVYVTGTTLLSGQVTVDNGMFYVLTSLGVGNASQGDIVSINNGKVSASTYDVKIGGKINFIVNQGTHYELTAAKVQNLVTGFGTTARVGQTISIPYSTISSPEINANSPKIDLTVPDAISTITVDDNPPAGKIGFKYTTLSNSQAVAVNFNIADTQAYKDGVSAARNSVEVGLITWTGPTVSDNQSEAHGKHYSLSATIPLVYQTGVDGQGEPVYTTIRTYGPISQNITGVYDAGWTAGDIAGYTRGYGIGQQDVCAGSGSVTATWDSDDHIYNLSSSIDIMSSSADSADVLFLASASGTLTPTDAINYGKDSVTLGEFTWSEYTQQNPSLPPNRTVSINVLGRATAINPKRLNLYLTNSGNWSPEHKQAVYLRAGNASGTQFAAVTLDATSEYYLGKSSVLFTDSGWSNGQRTIGISGRTDASGTANDESRTMNISVPNFSIYSAYDSGTGLLTFSASSAAKDGTATVATGTGSSDYTLSSTALTLKSNAFVYDANSTYSGYLPIVYNSGGVFKVGNTSTISANVTQYNQRVVLGQPSATIVWNSNTHKYDYKTDAAVSFGSTNVLTRTNSGHVLNPTEAIEYGKTLAPASSAVDSVKKNGSAEFSTNYKTVYIPVSAYDASNNVLWSSTIGTRSTYVSADISDSYIAGQNSVEISTATLSNLVYNSSARSATAVLTVSLTNGKSKTYSDRVDVSTPYQAGLDGRSAVNTQSFRIKLTDYSGFEIDKTYAVNTKAIYDKGVEDATPPSEYPYQAKVETSRAGTGGSVNLRASSSTSASILTAIPNGATINTKVELGTTPNESGAWYNADWVEVQYGNFTGYVQSQFVLNTVKYWQTQPKYIYGVYSDGFTPPVEVGVKVPGRTGLVIFNLMNNKSAAMAQQGGLYEQDITGTPTNVYSSSWRAIGKTCYVCYSDGTTRSYTIEDENA